MRRYAVTMHAEMGITADDEDEVIRNCNSDVREFVAQNEVRVASVTEVKARLGFPRISASARSQQQIAKGLPKRLPQRLSRGMAI